MKAELDPIVHALRGSAGNFVYRKVRGKTVMSAKPVRDESALTPAQEEHRLRFKKAVAYSKTALANNEVRPLYDAMAKDRNKPVFSVAVADYFNAPVIHEVDVFGYNGNIGDTISILASDDFEVVNVHVMIADTQGNMIENGNAVETAPGSGQWIYTATVSNESNVNVQVVAVDRPGGTAVMNTEKTF